MPHPGIVQARDAEFFCGSQEVVGLRVVDGGAAEDLDAPSVGEGG